MKNYQKAVVAGLILAGGVSLLPETTLAQGFKMSARERGHCKLIHVTDGKEIYNGTCLIKQTKDQHTNLFEIRLGKRQPLLFASTDGTAWMHGPEKVRFRDRGDSAIFRWGNFRLEVDDD